MDQWPYEQALWQRESGWNAYAANPTSNARGIPQNINGWSAYAPGDYQAQIRWGDAYIKNRPGYGNPQRAWAHEVAFNWYDKGGWLKPGLTLAVNNSGRPEQVIPAGRGHGGGVTVVLENRGVIGSRLELENWLVRSVDAARRKGRI
jgi:SLT domain-containing protein